MQIVTFTAADPKMPYSPALFGQNSLQGCRSHRGRGGRTFPPDVGIPDKPISIIRGADNAQHITTCLPPGLNTSHGPALVYNILSALQYSHFSVVEAKNYDQCKLIMNRKTVLPKMHCTKKYSDKC